MSNLAVRQPVVLSWSGGKDSALALSALSRDPRFKVVGLLTSITRGYDRVSVHGVRRAMLEAQVKRLGLPLSEIALEQNCTNEAYEAAFHEALGRIRSDWPEVSHIAFGDLFLGDVRAYRERLLEGSRPALASRVHARAEGHDAASPLGGQSPRVGPCVMSTRSRRACSICRSGRRWSI